MRPKPLGVTRISLTTGYASLCDSSRCNTYDLYKGPLIKCRWLVKCRWCLTSAPWTSSTSSSSTSHLHYQHGMFNSNSVSLRHKHCPEMLFIHINRCIRNQFFLKNIVFSKTLFSKILFLNNFYFREFCLILFDLILFYFNFFFGKFL